MTASASESGAGSALILVGMMGVGKSSVGRALARQLGWRLIDSDHEIEQLAGRRIPDIFAVVGEQGFRELETEVLRGLPDREAVVSLGGGALGREQNRALLAGKGQLVWLDASIDTLVERTSRSGARPLLAGLDAEGRAARLRALEAQRRPVYALAKWRVATDGATPEQVARDILRQLERPAGP